MGADPPDTSPAVLVDDRQSTPVEADALADLARRTLEAEGLSSVELSLSFVDIDEIEDLHVRYMEEPGPTDVLSFPLGEPDDRGVSLLGDVVICPAFAATQNDDLEAEMRLLVVHGILHLLGHDHEGDAERATMWEKQERYSGVRVP